MVKIAEVIMQCFRPECIETILCKRRHGIVCESKGSESSFFLTTDLCFVRTENEHPVGRVQNTTECFLCIEVRTSLKKEKNVYQNRTCLSSLIKMYLQKRFSPVSWAGNTLIVFSTDGKLHLHPENSVSCVWPITTSKDPVVEI